MKSVVDGRTSVLLFAACIVWTNCGDSESPLAPSPTDLLTGTYAFVSLTAKANNITIGASDLADLDGPGELPVGAITGSLQLTETTSVFRWVTTPAGAAPIVATAQGTHTILGSMITFMITSSTGTQAVPVGTDTLSFDLSGNTLTLEDDEKRFVYQRQ